MFLRLGITVKNYKMNFFLLLTTILGIQARSFNWNKVRIRILTCPRTIVKRAEVRKAPMIIHKYVFSDRVDGH